MFNDYKDDTRLMSLIGFEYLNVLTSIWFNSK